jgi:hypothetical protein
MFGVKRDTARDTLKEQSGRHGWEDGRQQREDEERRNANDGTGRDWDAGEN